MFSKHKAIVFLFLVFGQMLLYGGGEQAESFTKKILSNFTVDELKQANFLLKDTLILTRIVPHGETRGVDEGTLSIVNGERIETITIPTNINGKLISVNKNTLEISYSPNNADRRLFFSKELLGDEYYLYFRGSTLKYGQYDYKVNKKPKLLVQFNEQFIRERTNEKETGW